MRNGKSGSSCERRVDEYIWVVWAGSTKTSTDLHPAVVLPLGFDASNISSTSRLVRTRLRPIVSHLDTPRSISQLKRILLPQWDHTLHLKQLHNHVN